MIVLGASARRAGGLLLALAMGTEAIFVTSAGKASPTFCTVYTHMVKAGGSSIKQQLSVASHKDGELFCNQGGASDEACLEAASNATIITGGNVEKLRCSPILQGSVADPITYKKCCCRDLPSCPKHVDPVFYCPQDHDIQNRPPEWCGYSDHPTPVTERLTGFLRNGWGNIAFRQFSVGLFCHQGLPCAGNQHRRTSVVEQGDDNILQKVEAIMGNYTAVGIMEYWDLSMQLFNAKVKSPVLNWELHRHANPGTVSPLRDEIYQWAHGNPEIHEIVATDMLLYSYALSLFKLQTSETLGTSWS